MSDEKKRAHYDRFGFIDEGDFDFNDFMNDFDFDDFFGAMMFDVLFVLVKFESYYLM